MRFEIVSTYKDKGINLPKRATIDSAGYDFECAEYTIVPAHAIVLIPTGIKCRIDDGYYLQLALRSSTPKKKGLILANGIGIIDSGYWQPDGTEAEGHIMFQVYNFTDTSTFIEKGERIGQGVFLKYYKTDDDTATGIRNGFGFGSTDSAYLTQELSHIFDHIFDIDDDSIETIVHGKDSLDPGSDLNK